MYKQEFDGTLRALDLLARIGAEERVGDSLSSHTISLYGRKIRHITARHAGGKISELTPEMVVRDLVDRIDTGEITRSTARIEKSAALFWIAEQAQTLMDSGSSEFGRYESAYRDILSLGTKQLPSKSEKTSGSKLRAFPDEAVDLLFKAALTDKSPGLINALLFIRANLHVGLRPIEWFNSKFITYQHRNALGEPLLENGEPVFSHALEIQNAKHSAIRGNGEKRIILLDRLSDQKRQHLMQWWQAAQQLISDELMLLTESEINRRIFGSMQRAVRRVLLRAGWNTEMPTLYSTRHQAVANARADGLSKIEIAALFGHSSTHTARQHYGRKYAGYAGRSGRPSPESVMAVRSISSNSLPDVTWSESSVHNPLPNRV